MFNLTLLGGNRIDASVLEPGERLACLVLFGGLEIDFTACASAPLVEIFAVTILGGLNVKVRPEQPVRLDGFSVLGGRNVEPCRLPAPSAEAADGEVPIEIAAYGIFSGINVERKA
jgi:hypothetical protein